MAVALLKEAVSMTAHSTEATYSQFCMIQILATQAHLQQCPKDSRIGQQCLAAKAGMSIQLLKTVKNQTMQRMARPGCSSGATIRYVDAHGYPYKG